MLTLVAYSLAVWGGGIAHIGRAVEPQSSLVSPSQGAQPVDERLVLQRPTEDNLSAILRLYCWDDKHSFYFSNVDWQAPFTIDGRRFTIFIDGKSTTFGVSSLVIPSDPAKLQAETMMLALWLNGTAGPEVKVGTTIDLKGGLTVKQIGGKIRAFAAVIESLKFQETEFSSSFGVWVEGAPMPFIVEGYYGEQLTPPAKKDRWIYTLTVMTRNAYDWDHAKLEVRVDGKRWRRVTWLGKPQLSSKTTSGWGLGGDGWDEKRRICYPAENDAPLPDALRIAVRRRFGNRNRVCRFLFESRPVATKGAGGF